MRLLFVADGRSPIAINWIRYWTERGDEVHLASTFACDPGLDLASLRIIPVAFSGTKSSPSAASSSRKSLLWGAATLNLRLALRHWAGPLTIRKAAQQLRGYINEVQPNLVHALRIPYEGMLAADAYQGTPLLVSVWGNDFTLHAPSTPLMQHYTRWTLQVAHALHTDCRRDIRLAHEWGLPADRETIVLPGNGGIDTDLFRSPAAAKTTGVIINPRGFRNYVRNDTFFRAIPLVLKQRPDAHFVCANMAGESQALRWIEELEIGSAVELLPKLDRTELAGLYQQAQVSVSPSTHDGTPNSLLEAMACGCVPVAGDLESIREWITPGQNGLLVDPTDPQALALAILRALNDDSLQKQAVQQNQILIVERAEYQRCMAQAEHFYARISANN